MKKQHTHITYTIIDPNKNYDLKSAIKEAVIEKLILINRSILTKTD